MGSSNVSGVHATWRGKNPYCDDEVMAKKAKQRAERGEKPDPLKDENQPRLTHRARLLLDKMALVSLDADAVPVYVESWIQRAEFLTGCTVPRSDKTRPTELVRKRAWQAQADAIKQLVAAHAIVSGEATHNKSGYVREAFAVDILGTLSERGAAGSGLVNPSKKLLDANPGRDWTWSGISLDATQEIPWRRNQEEPQDSLQGHTTHPGALTTDRARETANSGIEIAARMPHDFVPGDSGRPYCDACGKRAESVYHDLRRASA